MQRILLGITGSVAAIYTHKLVDSLSKIGEVRVVTTKSGQYFLDQSGGELKARVFQDKNEWPPQFKLGDPVLHIELRKWASCFLVAPLDANTLAKFDTGLCDNLLTCVFRAWDWKKPMFVCPAMNTFMWENSPTREQILRLRQQRKVKIIEPITKTLACGDTGPGAMADHDLIVQTVKDGLRWLFPLRPGACAGIPINHHPGAFGFHRRKNHHTGVDLYCEEDDVVLAVEDGVVVKRDIFTGPKVGHDWWEETWGVMVDGNSGVVNYGEIVPCVDVGKAIRRGDKIGNVKRVLFKDRQRPDIPGHKTSMLHLELYESGTTDFADWHDLTKNPNLLDPTQYLISAEHAPEKTLTWDNADKRTVG